MSKFVIREARMDKVPSDLPGLVALAKEGHERSAYSRAPFVEEAMKENLRVMINSKMHCVFVAEKDGVIVGAIAGMTNELFYSRKKFATDLWFYVSDEGKGSGQMLMRRFVEWAKRPGVREITTCIMSEMEDVARTEELYTKLGWREVGKVYVFEGDKDE